MLGGLAPRHPGQNKTAYGCNIADANKPAPASGGARPRRQTEESDWGGSQAERAMLDVLARARGSENVTVVPMPF